MTATPGRMSGKPGDVIPIAVVFDHKGKWHTQAGKEAAGSTPVDPDAITTKVSVVSDDPRFIARADAVQWPAAKVLETRAMGGASKVAVFEGRSIVYIPVEIAPDAKSGNGTLAVNVSFQACDDKVCLNPADQRFELTLAVASSAGSSGWTYPELFGAYRPVSATQAPLPPGSAAGVGLLTILTAVLVGVGVIGVVVIALLRKK